MDALYHTIYKGTGWYWYNLVQSGTIYIQIIRYGTQVRRHGTCRPPDKIWLLWCYGHWLLEFVPTDSLSVHLTVQRPPLLQLLRFLCLQKCCARRYGMSSFKSMILHKQPKYLRTAGPAWFLSFVLEQVTKIEPHGLLQTWSDHPQEAAKAMQR